MASYSTSNWLLKCSRCSRFDIDFWCVMYIMILFFFRWRIKWPQLFVFYNFAVLFFIVLIPRSMKKPMRKVAPGDRTSALFEIRLVFCLDLLVFTQIIISISSARKSLIFDFVWFDDSILMLFTKSIYAYVVAIISFTAFYLLTFHNTEYGFIHILLLCQTSNGAKWFVFSIQLASTLFVLGRGAKYEIFANRNSNEKKMLSGAYRWWSANNKCKRKVRKENNLWICI